MQFFRRQWFLIALALALLVGFALSGVVMTMTGSPIVRNCIVAIVLFLMALPLEARELARTLRRPIAPCLAILLNSVVLPLLAWPVAIYLLSGGLKGGLLVAACVPCTMASAAVWTRRGGGNVSVAILVTVVTNFFCFLIAPLWLHVFTGQAASVSMSGMAAKLAVVVVLPMAVGQLLRSVPTVAARAADWKKQIGILAQIGILIMVCSGAAQMSQRIIASDTATSQQPWSVASLVTTVIAVNIVHLATLWLGISISRAIGLPRSDQIAVGISGSQKTLMVGIAIALDLGFSILPMLVYHVCQLLTDTVIVDRFRERSDGER